MKENEYVFNVKKLVKRLQVDNPLKSSFDCLHCAVALFIQVEALTLSKFYITRKSAILKYLSYDTLVY